MPITCPECGHENELDAVYCDDCGSKLPEYTPNSNSASQSEEKVTVGDISDDRSDEIAQQAETTINPQEKEETEMDREKIAAETTDDNEAEATKDPEEKEEFVSLPMSELENLPASVPVSTATRLELTEEEEAALQKANAPSPTVLQLSRAALIDIETETRFEFPTTKKTIYIGRANEELAVQVDLSDLADADIVSRVHAAIHLEEEKFFLEDAGSVNGTWLNGEKLKTGVRFRKEINSGDEIAFGKNQSIKLLFENEE